MTVTFSDIEAAAAPYSAATVVHTPSSFSPGLSRIAGCELYLKLENLQHTGSFKVRGALEQTVKPDAQQGAGSLPVRPAITAKAWHSLPRN